jgi:hypothetical protein
MARLVNQIPWYVTQTLERSARLGSAVDVYSHLSGPRQLAATQARRDQFAREMRQIRHLVQSGVDEDKPVAAPRPRITEQQVARAMYPDLDHEHSSVSQRVIDGWQALADARMYALGFKRTGR